MATVTIQPDGDVTTEWNVLPVSPGTHYTAIDEGVGNDTDYVYASGASTLLDRFDMETPSLSGGTWIVTGKLATHSTQ